MTQETVTLRIDSVEEGKYKRVKAGGKTYSAWPTVKFGEDEQPMQGYELIVAGAVLQCSVRESGKYKNIVKAWPAPKDAVPEVAAVQSQPNGDDKSSDIRLGQAFNKSWDWVCSVKAAGQPVNYMDVMPVFVFAAKAIGARIISWSTVDALRESMGLDKAEVKKILGDDGLKDPHTAAVKLREFKDMEP